MKNNENKIMISFELWETKIYKGKKCGDVLCSCDLPNSIPFCQIMQVHIAIWLLSTWLYQYFTCPHCQIAKCASPCGLPWMNEFQTAHKLIKIIWAILKCLIFILFYFSQSTKFSAPKKADRSLMWASMWTLLLYVTFIQ